MSKKQAKEPQKRDSEEEDIGGGEEEVQQQQQNQEEEQEEAQSGQTWNLSDKELKALAQIQREAEEALRLAQMLEKQSSEVDPDFERRADQSISAVNNVVEAMKEEFSRNETDGEIKLAVESTILRLSTKNKRLEEEKYALKNLVKERNEQVRALVLRVKQMEKLLLDKEGQVERLEQQLTHLNRNVSKLQSKADDEYRAQLIQEQLRQPKEKQSVAQQQFSSMLGRDPKQMPLFLEQSRFQDGNVKGDGGFDFWRSDGAGGNAAEYPGNPKRLHDVVNQKNLWVGQNEDDALSKFQYQRGGGGNQRASKQREQDFWQQS